MEFAQIDVFAAAPFRGNPLAIFPDADELGSDQMQAIAREMNLSETSFVTAATRDEYAVRIFTPAEELPFAGHPTIGTAWFLRRLGRVTGDRSVQRSQAGPTEIRFDGDVTWFEREGTSQPDIAEGDPKMIGAIAAAVGADEDDIGLDACELGRSGMLAPAAAAAGLVQLMVPVADLAALGRLRPHAGRIEEMATMGAYCFTAAGAGRVQARGFFPDVGVEEDPATGSAAAGLGIYLADRVGDIDLEIAQGVEMGRPSSIQMKATKGSVSIGGRCQVIFEGRLESLP